MDQKSVETIRRALLVIATHMLYKRFKRGEWDNIIKEIFEGDIQEMTFELSVKFVPNDILLIRGLLDEPISTDLADKVTDMNLKLEYLREE